MVADTGATAVILGHSERREDHNESSALVRQKARAVLETGLTAIAYEPVWAIGTGKTPTTEQIDEVHDFNRARLVRRFGEAEGRAIRLLYGGSVKPGNAAEIFATDNVDGALVGGASLKAEDFSPIIKALEATA